MPRPVHRVRTAAWARGMTLRELATAAGVSPSVLGMVLGDRMSSWPGLRERVAKALELPEEELFPERQVTVR